jgi:hypothetical protein
MVLQHSVFDILRFPLEMPHHAKPPSNLCNTTRALPWATVNPGLRPGPQPKAR